VRTLKGSAVPAFALVLISMSGCGAEPDLAPRDLVGEPLELLTSAITEQTTLLVQDVSVVVGRAPTYDENEDASAWEVVAACSDHESIAQSVVVEVAVVPASAMTAGLEERLRAGELDDAVSCEGLPFR
jgi:hypothetical protein